MFDFPNETRLRLDEAAKLVPPSRRAKSTHISTILRWILNGARTPSGEIVRLEAYRCGSKWITSVEALQRFCERLTPSLGVSPPVTRTAPARARANQRAARELEKHGI
jgi:hypothetical protein